MATKYVEVSTKPVADLVNGRYGLFYRHYQVAKGDSIDYYLDEWLSGLTAIASVTAEWAAGSGSVSVSSNSAKALSISGIGCVNISVKSNLGTNRLAFQLDDLSDMSEDLEVLVGEKYFECDTFSGIVRYTAAGSNTIWLNASSPGCHTMKDGREYPYSGIFRDVYVHRRVCYELEEAPGSAVSIPFARAFAYGTDTSEGDRFEAYVGKACDVFVEAVSADKVTIKARPYLLKADDSGNIGTWNWAVRDYALKITAYTLTAGEDATVSIGSTIDLSGRFKVETDSATAAEKLYRLEYDIPASKYATIDSSGKATGVKAGDPKVYVYLRGAVTGYTVASTSITLTVMDSGKVRITPHDRKMTIGRTRKAGKFFTVASTAQSYTLEYSISGAAAELGGEHVIAVAAGTAKLTCKASVDGGSSTATATATITVVKEEVACIAVAGYEWVDSSDLIVADGKTVKAVYVCDASGNLAKFYG